MTKAVRWDPRSRAGAIAVRPRPGLDVDALNALSENLQEVAQYQDMGGGEMDTHESSPVSGTYDWRAYLQEEAQAAMERESQRRPDGARHGSSPKPRPVNWRLYA